MKEDDDNEIKNVLLLPQIPFYFIVSNKKLVVTDGAHTYFISFEY